MMSGKYTLTQLRAGKHWSQGKAANALGISLSTWRKWEKQESFPTQPNVEKILNQFDVKYEDVIF
jgi:DNA-binding transcriptional regulator YiaG